MYDKKLSALHAGIEDLLYDNFMHEKHEDNFNSVRDELFGSSGYDCELDELANIHIENWYILETTWSF